MQRLLFLCSRNRRRSPTAERIYAADPALEVSSAGLAPDAEEPLTEDHLEGIDVVLVMEKRHRARLNTRFGRCLGGVKIVCLDIPDDYEFMDAALIDLIKARAGPYIRRGSDARLR